jgi:Na+/proline symporter
MATVFKMPMSQVLLILGSVVTVVALVGGAWAVLASDFVQMFLVVTITIVTAALTLAQPSHTSRSASISAPPGSPRAIPLTRFCVRNLTAATESSAMTRPCAINPSV